MADVSAKDAKLIQWLNEAYGKEKQLETALAAHIAIAEQATYKKRLQQHLKETKDHARQVERRIKKLGGKAEAVDLPGPDAVGGAATAIANVAGRAVAQAQGAVHAARGTSGQEKQLKNAKDDLHEEAEEIANYTAIIALAEAVDDKDTVTMAKSILREEQRMYDFVQKQIPKLTKEVVKAEIPASERKKASSSRSRSSSRSSSSRTSGSSSSRSRGSSKGSSSGGARSGARKAASTAGKTAKTAAKSGSTAARKTGSAARSSGKSAVKRTATTARKSASGSSSKASGSSSRSRKKS